MSPSASARPREWWVVRLLQLAIVGITLAGIATRNVAVLVNGVLALGVTQIGRASCRERVYTKV